MKEEHVSYQEIKFRQRNNRRERTHNPGLSSAGINIDVLINAIEEIIPTPKRRNKPPFMHIIRLVNKPEHPLSRWKAELSEVQSPKVNLLLGI